MQEKGFLKSNYTENTFSFLMEITKGISLLYFQENGEKNLNKKEYCKKIIKVLFPYLTDKGKLKYIKL